MPASAQERAALYRLYDASNRLLYIGIAENPGRRWDQHATTKPWWPQVAEKTVEWRDTREEAAAAEAEAIRTELPLFNNHYLPSPIETDKEIRRHRSSSPSHQIASALRTAIKAGEYPSGTKLPTLRDLQDRFQTTNATIQRALQQLKDEGLVEGRLGSGTYVLDRGRQSAIVPLYDLELTAETLRRALTSAELSRLAALLMEPE